MTSPVLHLLGVVLIAGGLAGLLLPAVPGTPLIVLGITAVAWADGFTRIGYLTLAVVALLGVASWVVEYLAGVLGAKKAGASRWGVAGAFVGLLAGLPFGLLGLVLGPGVGATLFEYFKDPHFRRAARAGTGVFVGFVIGTAVKYALAFTMIGIAVFAYVF